MVIAGGANSFSPVMIAFVLVFFFGHLPVDEIIVSLSRSATAFKLITAVTARSLTGNVPAVVQAGFSVDVLFLI